MGNIRPAIVGANSLVGNYIVNLLIQQGLSVTAFTRKSIKACPHIPGVAWVQLQNQMMKVQHHDEDLTLDGKPSVLVELDVCISVAPIWLLPEHFGQLKSHGIKKIIALSSTSVLIKCNSPDPYENQVAVRLLDGEAQLQKWATDNEIDWVILRPTLIYGSGKDKNIAEISRFIRKFGFFPLFGHALGLRQPVHAEDVAKACILAMSKQSVRNCVYNLSGGETLTYYSMVCRIFAALGLRPRLVRVPLWVFHVVLSFLRIIPRYRHWTSTMAVRMNQDLCFEHSEASRDFGYTPRAFEPFGEV